MLLIEDIRRIPNDAIPLSDATKSKLSSLSRNLSFGWLSWISDKSKTARVIQKAIKKENIALVKEGLEDWVSYSEDL